MSIDYDQVFQRNIGVLTYEEQQRLKKSCVLIAGAGGVGSPTAIALCRLGVGKIIVCDFDVYDVSNINRQLPCTVKTVGKSKASVLAEHLRDIHSFSEIVSIEDGINSGNVDALVSQADMVVSAIDGCITMLLQKACKKHKKLCITAALLKEKVMSTSFPPDGVSISDLYRFEIDEKNIAESEYNYKRFLNKLFNRGNVFEHGYAPTTSAGIFIAAGLLANQTAFYLARGQITIPSFPAHIVFDANTMLCVSKMKIFDTMRRSKLFHPVYKKTVHAVAKIHLAGLK